jgi:ADP-heptose:LPS heptosyltransferase
MAKRDIILFSLITDDVYLRLKPICDYLSRKYSKITVLLFDWHRSNLDCSHILNSFHGTPYAVATFRTVTEGSILMRQYGEADFLYLVKHTQINYNLSKLLYLFIINHSKHKFIIECNIIHLRYYLSQRRRKNAQFPTVLLIFRNSLLHILFKTLSILAYYFIFSPLALFLNTGGNKSTSLPTPVNNILFPRMDHLGDIICTLPSLHSLKRKFPASKITFLAARWSSGPLRDNPHLYDELMLWDAPWHDKKKKFYGIFGLHKLIPFLRRLRATEFDLTIQPRGDGMDVAIAVFSRHKHAISGIDTNRPLSMSLAKFIDTPVLFNYYKTYHLSEWPALCLKTLDIKISKKDIIDCFKTYVFPDIETELDEWKKKDFTVCALMIGSGNAARQWPVNKFCLLIEALYRKKIVTILLGSQSEINTENKIIQSITVPIIDMVDKTDFKRLSSILRNSDFTITLDTSIMHLASLVNIKTIALFGPGNINLAKPVFSRNSVIKKELGCSGCGDICHFAHGKVYTPCMNMITVSDVLKSVENIDRME